ncbi:cytochrome C heme lyase [Vibrio sp. qd031]|uniref:c-type cytochrome biogenesis protein CcmI n=1 Tax=Vibrio sp. qd031 TaxID=1603038 RepID=UPI000A0F5B91|nr:c-type cytochrome biogenesis protein CcmI [Vibrio sp. qd031]ORT49377.1 cytochrome C heme lyase [Vibrio sp. qd031]
MVEFWLAAGALLVVSALFVVIPLLRSRDNTDEQLRDELNKAIYKDRLAELEVESVEGIVQDKAELETDLKLALLDDVPNSEQHGSTQKVSPVVIVVSLALLIFVTLFCYQRYGALDKVSQWQEVANQLPQLSQRLMSQDAEPLTDSEMRDLILALRTRLHHTPQDQQGWLLLGRIGLADRDIDTAIGAMKRAYRLSPDDEDIQLGYAQALMLSGDATDTEIAEGLLIGLAQQEYVDLRVISLLAFNAFEKQDFAGAVKYWTMMQQMIGPEDSRYPMLESSIRKARANMGESMADMVAVEIRVADDVPVNPNGVLVVSVHRADGSAMPVAAARYNVGAFPRTLVLDDGNSMMQGQNLSDLDAYIVRARIDSDGNVGTREGDWYGESAVTQKGNPVNLVISNQY